MAKYHQNGALVQELINGKVISNSFKDHPEFVGNTESGFEIEMYFFNMWGVGIFSLKYGVLNHYI